MRCDVLGAERARCHDRLAGPDPADLENGCMKFVAGSHHRQVDHRDTFDQHNLLTRGQEVAVTVDEDEAVVRRAHARPGLAPPCHAGPRLGAEPLRRPPHRLRHPLHPDAYKADRRRDRQRDLGARRRQLRQIRARDAPRRRCATRRRWRPMPRSRRGSGRCYFAARGSGSIGAEWGEQRGQSPWPLLPMCR